MSLSVIIPVLNEEKTILQVINKVLKQKNTGEIIIVDDGSTDKTPQILAKLNPPAGGPKIKVLTHPQNRGKGAALRTAFPKVSKEYALIQDADLEYDPKQFDSLFKAATPKTVIYGSRILGQNRHAYTRTYLGNVMVTGVFNILFGGNLTDSYTCYKLIPKKILQSLKLDSDGFEIEAEITAKLAKKGVKIVEVPIKYNPRKYEQGKKIKAKDAIKGVLKYLTIFLS